MSSSKWLTITLVVSLGANIALVGFLAGRASQFDLRPGNLDPMMGFARILPELSRERHDVLRPLVREHMRSVKPSIREIRRAQRDLGAALLAEPFERAQMEDALTKFRKHLAHSQVSSHAAFVELVEQLTPGERRLLVEAQQRNPRQRRFPPRNHQRREDGG
ncbi:MAG: periplasmic heavy metal sensor [Gammaproteobacteria bacterium]|nr:periplasmic heavy metal sensor [Gammaproteobacteria bacterium]